MLIERWLWGGNTISARLTRLALFPPSLAYRFLAAARTSAYRHGLLSCQSAAVPTIAVGNLTVGGSGKTPLTAWIARYYSRSGFRPGIILRGYGGDEGAVHRRLVREAVVVENPNRIAGARQAVSKGAEVIVLDDAFQRLDIARNLNIAVVSTESGDAPPWTLPAGPWREGWHALRRADLAIVTRKRARRAEADALVRRIEKEVGGLPVAVVHLGIECFHCLLSGDRVDPSELDGARVVAAAGVADPDSFTSQCTAMGATVSVVRWRDHQSLSDRDLSDLALVGTRADYVAITEKDAVKMRGRWPEGYVEPLVAKMDLVLEKGGDTFREALNRAVAETDK